MMIWIPDQTGRFRQRPYFFTDEMDRRCERIVDRFNCQLYGQPFPGLRTGALIKLLEKYADLYLYEDLSDEGEGIEAVTYFRIGKKPIVRISRELTFDPSQNHHTRFVIAHEYGHVRLHAVGWRRRWIKQEDVLRCSAKNVLTLDNGYDWLEWQASFLGASSLLPQTRVHRVVETYFHAKELEFVRVPQDSRQARDLAQRAGELFEVSDRVAHIRLSQLGYLID
jgi:hypothetical protein